MPRILNDEGEEVCQHTHTEMRLRTLKNGSTAVQCQCVDCGEATSKALKKTSITPEALAALPAFDDRLRQSTREQRDREAKVFYEQRRIERGVDYDAYLQTPKWKARAKAVMARDDYLCQNCLFEGRHGVAADHVHHLTYQHKYDERLFELVALCTGCHKSYHEDWV